MDLKFDVKCPNCHRKFPQKVSDMRPGRTRKCPYCGLTIEFSGDDGREAQKALDDLKRTLNKLR